MSYNLDKRILCNNEFEYFEVQKMYLNNGFEWGGTGKGVWLLNSDILLPCLILVDVKNKSLYFSYCYNDFNYMASDILSNLKIKEFMNNIFESVI